MSNWTKLSKHCYVGRIGPATYWVKYSQRANDWFIYDGISQWGSHKTAQQAMLAAEEMK